MNIELEQKLKEYVYQLSGELQISNVISINLYFEEEGKCRALVLAYDSYDDVLDDFPLVAFQENELYMIYTGEDAESIEFLEADFTGPEILMFTAKSLMKKSPMQSTR